MASNHGSSAIDERGGAASGHPRRCRWVERATAWSLGVTLASGALAGYAPGLARAQSSSRSTARSGATPDRAAIQQADAAFKEGRAFFDRGRYAEACQKFELSMQLDPSPGTSLNLGNCYEPQGDLMRALENFERAFADAQQTKDVRRKELWTEAARERIANLSRRVPQLSFRNVPPDARISVDQQPLERTRRTMRVNPGLHLVQVSAPGKRPFERDVDIAAAQRLAIDIPPLEADQSPPGTREQADPDLEHPRGEGTSGPDRYGPWPYVLGGAGAVLLAAGIGTGLAANAKENELEHECVGTACPPDLEGTRDSAKTLAVFADVFWVTGLLTAGVGVTLFILDSPDDKTNASVEAGCFGSGCGLIANGHF